MKTVKVRVAVAVDPKGSWYACGADIFDDKEAMSYATYPLEAGELRYFLTAELAVPENEDIPATVEPSQDDLEYSMETTISHKQGKVYCDACGQTLNQNVPEVCSNCGRRIVQ